MANPTQALRKLPLDGRLGGGAGVSITPADPMSRISLRVKEKDVKAVGKALGVALPVKPKTSSTSSDAAGRSALWIGPDEWLILDDETADLSGALAKTKAVISVVDISHRNTAILLEGPKAVEVLRSGCPQNLNDDVFPVGACSRTILGKAEVVIWRTDAQSYHVECWRSFSDYTFKFMVQAAKGL